MSHQRKGEEDGQEEEGKEELGGGGRHLPTILSYLTWSTHGDEGDNIGGFAVLIVLICVLEAKCGCAFASASFRVPKPRLVVCKPWLVDPKPSLGVPKPGLGPPAAVVTSCRGQ